MLANFQGPFCLHPVMARALKVPGNRFRLRTPPDSGGSFGVKQAIFPYIVLIAVAARVAGRPVKWIEDRLEHLAASVSATNRVTTLEAAVDGDGRIGALAFDQLEDCGAYLRAPEPATLYRMHGNMTGAYDIRHVKIRNRIVLTNKTPTGLNRGFGGPQAYYPLERLMQRIAIELKLDPLEVIRRNLVPASAMPYRTATGALLDSGDFAATLAAAVRDGRLDELMRAPRRGARRGRSLRHRLCRRRRAERFQYGLHHGGADAGRAPPRRTEERRPGDRNHQPRSARRRVGAGGLDAARPGPSHGAGAGSRRRARTKAAGHPRDRRRRYRQGRLVDRLGQLFQPVCAGRRRRRADGGVEFARPACPRRRRPAQRGAGGGCVRRRPRRRARKSGQCAAVFAACRRRALGAGHDPLPSSVRPSARRCSGRRPNSPRRTKPTRSTARCATASFSISAASRSIRMSGAVRIDRYVTMHDCGRILHPAMVAGQISGGFAQALGAALYEEYAYAPDGAFSPARSPIIWCRPRWKCRSRSFCSASRLRR